MLYSFNVSVKFRHWRTYLTVHVFAMHPYKKESKKYLKIEIDGKYILFDNEMVVRLSRYPQWHLRYSLS